MTQAKFVDDAKERETDDGDVEAQTIKRAPDGGWGWVIVFASFMCNMIVDGVCLSFGVLNWEIKDHFNADPAKTALVGSLLMGFYMVAGPFVSVLANRFGCRRVTIIGSVVATVAFILSIFSVNLNMMIITYGAMGGIGFGMIYLPSIVVIGYWFDKRRAFATGIAVCGSGIGTLVFGPSIKYLLTEYDLKGCILITAGIVLNCAVCGAVFRPVSYLRKTKRMQRGVVKRGAIMKALIAEKERQRTISNGSLDNCIITRDNRLIKIDKIDLRDKSNSYINRIRESLGFSLRSLNKSKNSLVIHKSVVDNVHEEVGSTCSTPIYKASRGKHHMSKSNTRDSGCIMGSPESQKTRSYNALPQDDPWNKLSQEGSLKNDISLRFHSASNPLVSNVVETSLVSIMEPNSRYSLHNSSFRSNRSSFNKGTAPKLKVVDASMMSVLQNNASVICIRSYKEESEWVTYFKNVRDMFDLSLLCRPTFLLYTFGSVLSMLAIFIPHLFLHYKLLSLGRGNVNMNDFEYLLSIIGIFNTIGRLLAGWIADRPWANPVFINNAALVIAGIISMLSPFYTTYSHLAIYAAGFGMFTAAFLSLRSIVLVELIGLEKLTSSFGLLILFQGSASMVAWPLTAYLEEVTDNLDIGFYLAGTLLIISGLLGFPLLRIKKWEEKMNCKPYEISLNYEKEYPLDPVKVDNTQI